MPYYNKTAQQTLQQLNSSEKGLTPSQVSALTKEHGKNTIKIKGEPLWRKLIEPFADVFMLVLFIAAGLSILHNTPIDAIIIISIMLISAIIYYVQRFSTDRVLRSLRKHAIQYVSVIRNGKTISTDSLNLVPGDIIVLTEGEKVPADARIIKNSGVRIDESLLTGESEAITKTVDALSGTKQIYEQSNILFQGSFMVAGEATAVVIRTANHTEFGRLAALAQPTEVRSPVQKKIDKLVNQIIAIIAAVSVVTFVLSLMSGTEMVEAVRFVMALAVSAVPESLPIAISVVLVLGMRRMAAKKALVRNMRSIETVGVITTIATDKTGTLTKNRLSIQNVWQPPKSTINLDRLIYQSANQSTSRTHDPLDVSMRDYASKKRISSKEAPLHSLTFSHENAMSGNLWHHGSAYLAAVKGAPEAILKRSNLSPKDQESAEAALNQLTSQGYRVIALAKTEVNKPIKLIKDLPKKTPLKFAGFIAVADTIRPEAKRSIQAAIKAGVTVRMITGDHFETAFHIGKQLGMVSERDQVFDSRRMDKMTDDELAEAIRDVRVFSRVIPENKHRLLTVLKRRHITAMTGDGVNDVPALTNAHIGFAMGSGSQITKDAGDIILLDDNFKTIIDAMREGRIIISNIRRMLYYLLATNAGEVMTILGSLLLGLPSPLAAVQILWVNLVTDTTMVIPLGLEKGEKDIMKRRPEKPNAPILNRYLVNRMILVAVTMAIVTLAIYVIFSNTHSYEYARTMAFCALVVMQWGSAFNSRSDYESTLRRAFSWSTPFYIGLALSILLQLLALLGPLQDLLHIAEVNFGDLLVMGILAFAAIIVVVEIHKVIGRRSIARQVENPVDN